MKYRILEFDPSAAPGDLLERYFFEDRMFQEMEPEDPLPYFLFTSHLSSLD